MNLSSSPRQRVRRDRERERERYEEAELERNSINNTSPRPRGKENSNRGQPQLQLLEPHEIIKTNLKKERAPSIPTQAQPQNQMPPRAPHRDHRKSSSISSSSTSGSPSSPQSQKSPPSSTSYPNYYDYSENAEVLPSPTALQHTPSGNGNSFRPGSGGGNMAMQVPIHPQQPPKQRLVDLINPTTANSASAGASPASVPRSQQLLGPVTTAQLAQPARGAHVVNGNSTSHSRGPSVSRDRPPSYSGSQHNGAGSGPRSPAEDIFPPNKVDLDAARYRHAQHQSRRDRDRERERERDRDRDRPPPPAKDAQTRRLSQANNAPNGRSQSLNLNMGPSQGRGHPHNGRPVSPESPMLTPPAIHRLPTPSIPNSVLQPLDAKVVEYGSLMQDAQGEMARLEDEMRAIQDRQREAEQRFLEAKAKHDDYRRQYADVQRALRGEFPSEMNLAPGGRSVDALGRDRGGDVPPMPSMPNLQQYGVQSSAQNSGMRLNGTNGGGPGMQQQQQHPGMRSQRTVSIQSDQDSLRPASKRGRWSRVFGIGT